MVFAARPSKNTRDAGFSLLELMVVVVILSILALVIVPRVIDRPDQARAARAQSDIAAISSAIKLYRLDNFRYPTTDQGLAALVTKPTTDPVPKNWATGGYMERLPIDPGASPINISCPACTANSMFSAMAPTGVSGGSDANADIGSWGPS